MHFNGIIGAQNDALIDTVIIDPLWLIDSFNELLQLNRHIDENVSRFSVKNSTFGTFFGDSFFFNDLNSTSLILSHLISFKMDVDVAKSFDTLEAGGILEDSLVDLAWRNKLNHKAVLLELMTRLDLTCQINVRTVHGYRPEIQFILYEHLD